MIYKIWMYHAEHEPKIFDSSEVEALEVDGWKDSPAKCKGFLDKINVDSENELQVQFVGEVVEATSDILNLEENIESLDREEIIKLANLRLQEDWSKKRGLERMRTSLRDRIA